MARAHQPVAFGAAASPFMGAALLFLTFRGSLRRVPAPRLLLMPRTRAEASGVTKTSMSNPHAQVRPSDASWDSLVRVGRPWEASATGPLKTRGERTSRAAAKESGTVAHPRPHTTRHLRRSRLGHRCGQSQARCARRRPNIGRAANLCRLYPASAANRY